MIHQQAAAWRWMTLPRVAGLRAYDLLAAVLLLALCTAGLGGAPLFDVDEGAFAEASREMLVSGDWGHTTLNGADRFDKPILVYWLQAASLALLGVSEAAVRLPSALCAWGWCLAVAAFVGARWGRASGWVAAAVLATSLGPLLIGRAATADALLNLLLALTLLDLWRWLTAESSRSGSAAWAWRRACLWIGLGLLAKGPVALVVPAGALLLWAAGGGRPAWRQLAAGLRDGCGWLLLLGTALPWYAYALARHGQAFVDGFLLRHNVQRFASALEGHAGSPLYHWVMLPLLLLPWTPLLGRLVMQIARQPGMLVADPSLRFPLAWCAFVLLFFSLAATKLPHYALYGVTPLAVLVAQRGGDVLLQRGPLLAVWGAAALLVLLGAASVPLAQAWATSAAAGDHWQQRLMAAWDLPGPASGLAPLLLVGMTVALVMAWHRAPLRLPVMGAVAAASALWWVLLVVPFWAQVLQGPVQRLVLESRLRNLTLVQWQLHHPSAGFYRGQAVPRRLPRAGEAALLRSDRLHDAQRQLGRPVVVLRREPGFVLVQVPGP